MEDQPRRERETTDQPATENGKGDHITARLFLQGIASVCVFWDDSNVPCSPLAL